MGLNHNDVLMTAELKAILKNNPNNRCAKYLAHDDVQAFFRCIKTGIDNPNSALGCYAMRPSDYETFGFFFDKVIGDYHKNDPNYSACHVTDWKLPTSEVKSYNLASIGINNPLSMRIRVGRNLTQFNLPGMMNKNERIELEKTLLPAFDELIKKYGGRVFSISPDHGENIENPNFITDAEYQKLVKDHVMFKDMDADKYLKSAGISSDWPYGRGCWQSTDKKKIIWFGEEDHLRIMVMKNESDLRVVFEELKEFLDTVESINGIKFATSKRYGYVTSCPSNLGTGMRASVHVKLPNLTADGTDTKVKAIAEGFGLSVRGTGGEHTPIGKDGTVDISPRARLFIKEKEIVDELFEGLKSLMKQEKNAKPLNM